VNQALPSLHEKSLRFKLTVLLINVNNLELFNKH